MSEVWLSLKDIPAEGREFSFSDPGLWAGPCAEFGLACEVREPLLGELEVLPQKDGYLLRGRLTGQVALPCDRCAEDALVTVEQYFDEFEPLPLPQEPKTARSRRQAAQGRGQAASEDQDQEEQDSTLLRETPGGVELDVGGLFWEQFLLALPVKPLCTEQCSGLCDTCGWNLNRGPCDCPEDEGDPRLAALRDMKLS